METKLNYKELNKISWNQCTPSHVTSEFYDNQSFIEGRNSLNSIELDLLGDLKGKSVLHLQCHFGQDTISLTRLGAEAVGIDLSDKAIESAQQLAEQTNSNAQFICSDVYELPQHLNQQFDVVYTSYGVIGWLPDMDKWAAVIAQFLKPGGKFVFVEFHPVVWMFDEDFSKVGYNYFNDGPIEEVWEGSYAAREATYSHKIVTWNHSMSEVIGSLLKQGLQLNNLQEFDYSPYNCFNKTIEIAPNQFRIEHLDNKIPMVYALTASKPKA